LRRQLIKGRRKDEHFEFFSNLIEKHVEDNYLKTDNDELHFKIGVNHLQVLFIFLCKKIIEIFEFTFFMIHLRSDL